MYVGCSPPLELDPVANVPHLQRVVLSKDHLLPEGLHSMLEIAGREENISLHHGMKFFIHMVPQVLLPWFLNDLLAVFDLNSCSIFAKLVHTIVHFAALLLQFGREVGAPPEIIVL